MLLFKILLGFTIQSALVHNAFSLLHYGDTTRVLQTCLNDGQYTSSNGCVCNQAFVGPRCEYSATRMQSDWQYFNESIDQLIQRRQPIPASYFVRFQSSFQEICDNGSLALAVNDTSQCGYFLSHVSLDSLPKLSDTQEYLNFLAPYFHNGNLTQETDRTLFISALDAGLALMERQYFTENKNPTSLNIALGSYFNVSVRFVGNVNNETEPEHLNSWYYTGNISFLTPANESNITYFEILEISNENLLMKFKVDEDLPNGLRFRALTKTFEVFKEPEEEKTEQSVEGEASSAGEEEEKIKRYTVDLSFSLEFVSKETVVQVKNRRRFGAMRCLLEESEVPGTTTTSIVVDVKGKTGQPTFVLCSFEDQRYVSVYSPQFKTPLEQTQDILKVLWDMILIGLIIGAVLIVMKIFTKKKGQAEPAKPSAAAYENVNDEAV